MLSNLLKSLLGSEPAIRLICRTATDKERGELIEALNAGAKSGLFNFRFNGSEYNIVQPGGDYRQLAAPTVEYNLDKFTRHPL